MWRLHPKVYQGTLRCAPHVILLSEQVPGVQSTSFKWILPFSLPGSTAFKAMVIGIGETKFTKEIKQTPKLLVYPV